MPSSIVPPRPWYWVAAALLLILGACLRWGAAASFQPNGPEELFYGRYVEFIAQKGVGAYPDLVEQYLGFPHQGAAVLPPMRINPILSAVAVHGATGLSPGASLNAVSAAYSILLLPLAWLAAWRFAGRGIALATLALLAVAPTQLFMARHALVDGLVAFWALAALWALWECLQQPKRAGRLVALGVSLAFLVWTRENFWIVALGLAALLGVNRWLRFGTVDRNTVVVYGAGLVLGAAVLGFVCGGLDQVAAGYRLQAAASAQFPYAILTADGPWYRFLFDLTVVSPLVVMLAITMLVRLNPETRPQLFIAGFFLATYAMMAALPLGMNLRLANLWDFPLCFLAASAVLGLAEKNPWRPMLIAGVSIALVATASLQQYRRIFVARNIDDPTTPELLRAVDILK